MTPGLLPRAMERGHKLQEPEPFLRERRKLNKLLLRGTVR